jgi:hypothetical protein
LVVAQVKRLASGNVDGQPTAHHQGLEVYRFLVWREVHLLPEITRLASWQSRTKSSADLDSQDLYQEGEIRMVRVRERKRRADQGLLRQDGSPGRKRW